jgi:hypothetical protein
MGARVDELDAMQASAAQQARRLAEKPIISFRKSASVVFSSRD